VAEESSERLAEQNAWQQQQFGHLQAQTERLERELRTEIAQSGVQGRQEAMQTLTLGSTSDRQPWFCSGCPHNTSTKVPEGSRAMAGLATARPRRKHAQGQRP
jgi:TPP-dependent indolepyruvate ferredoxin oxidoreductase alpha subunit